MKNHSLYHITYSGNVIVEKNILSRLAGMINSDEELKDAPRLLFVIDRNIQSSHPEIISQILSGLRPNYAVVLIDAGFKLKSLYGVESLYKIFYEHNLKRDSVIVSVGGGTLCDAVGFASATYIRGIKIINIPTTLMSCADPVLGKVAVNHLSQKNLIGTWFFPHLTLIDPVIIKKDSPRYFNTGISEIIKSAFINGKKTCDSLENDMGALVNGDEEIVVKYLEMSIKTKIKLVKGDEQDNTGEQSKLSLGHNLADVLESKASSEKLVTHGEAVALGMIFAALVNDFLEHSDKSKELLDRTMRLIAASNLPDKIPFPITREQIAEELLKSKKSRTGDIALVIVKDYGRVEIQEGISVSVINMASDWLLSH
ncbi:MAG: 3-dehydroquinate synthase family protein [bacterium]|nr:3-dehydroquinate synthase family protein [bacterium]